MEYKDIADPIGLFYTLGHLHDVWIEKFDIDVETRTVRWRVDDLNANSAGLDEYPGLRACDVIFNGVETCSLNLEILHGVWISDVRVEAIGTGFRLEVDLQDGAAARGGNSIVLSFASLQIRD